MLSRLRNRAPLGIRKAIVAPLLMVSGTVLAAVLIMGASVFMTAQKEATALNATSRMALHAMESAETLSEAMDYVLDIMSMTRMTPAAEVRSEFEKRLKSLNDNVELLRLYVDPDELEYIRELTQAIDTWTYQAEMVLGLRFTQNLPTLDHLNRNAARAVSLAEAAVMRSRTKASAVIENANASIKNSIQIGVGLTGALCLLTLIFASRMSGRMSAAMVDVSESLRDLADQQGRASERSPNEFREMFASLETLRESVAEKARMAEQLHEEKLRAEEAARTKSRFLANMSHEIRTPINGVLGMAEILNGTTLSFEQRECSQTILKSSEALLSVINDILDFSKNEAGEIQLEQAPFSLYEVVFDVAGLLGPAVGGHEVEISIDYADDLPRWFLGDAGRMRQVLMNVVGNAVKFTPQGHVIITVAHDPQQAFPLTIAVKDDGVGIPADKLDFIFDAFQQAEMQASRRFQGTGLGLAITRQLVRQMQGDIVVQSEEGQGSTFTMQMVLERCATPEGSPGRHTADLSSLVGKHVLVVDDLELNRAILRKSLRGWGMEVQCFDSPQAVLALSSEDLQRFDIGLLDYNMPNMCGDQLFQHLRKRLGETCFPTILYSSSDQTADFTRMTDIGFASVLMKPTRAPVMAQSFVSILQPSAPVAAPEPKQDELALQGLRILIAEDNKTNRLVISKMLRPTRADLTFCENGAVAVEEFRKGLTDLVFMDMSMPVMDGVTAARVIREFELEQGQSPCPIVALTANAMASDREACAEAGMSDFLTKPIRKADLMDCIAKWDIRSTVTAGHAVKLGDASGGL